jgi:SAM-dependent methyltransferase
MSEPDSESGVAHMPSSAQMNGNAIAAWREAKEGAETISRTRDYSHFVDYLRKEFPSRFKGPMHVLERDYLRIVDHHLEYLVPRLSAHMHPNVRCVLDFGCGSGGSAIALAMIYPDIRLIGTDIDPNEIVVARERAKLYKVADRCEFTHIEESGRLPFSDGFFDFCLCSSVIEYVVETEVRRFCVQEMARLVKPGGSLFFSVPNRLYPFEVHTRKWGWNYFPKLLKARTVDSTFWEVRRLARPTVLRLRPTPIAQFFRPWSNFCVQKLK